MIVVFILLGGLLWLISLLLSAFAAWAFYKLARLLWKKSAEPCCVQARRKSHPMKFSHPTWKTFTSRTAARKCASSWTASAMVSAFRYPSAR